MEEIKTTYIYHSGFLVEILDYILIFDYYKPPKDRAKFLDEIFSLKQNREKKIIFFSSHSHYDHFNPEILEWSKKNKNISYILSSDIYEENKIEIKDIYFSMKENEELDFNKDIKVYSFGSTDLGVSFLVKVKNHVLFHAGDLNWWNWGEEDTEEESKDMENKFKSIVSDIKKVSENLGGIEVAFFPVDPRLGKYQHDGANYFSQIIHPKVLIPMHYE
ncbi:MAG: MBL fold metallo-hydrolase [Cetobacterium sp.]|uniref:MBL fold metallo-hydrolase n=1 Tax=unclassified Cetobacterium TaxID=2630983 RepID=UPI00163D13A3|nr:MBL fold metallo-hydrolase [Cetobacterium sp. 2A]MBC2856059.1 MBL fold metallo-hydrolase [Cetobacterium sp. 2A]